MFDIGCGDGYVYGQLNKRKSTMHYTGSDINQHIVNHCRSKFPDAKWLHLKKLPYAFGSNAFDVVFVWNVMHHLNDDDDIFNLL